MHHNWAVDGTLGVEVWETHMKSGKEKGKCRLMLKSRVGIDYIWLFLWVSNWGERHLVTNHDVMLWLLRWNKRMATVSLTNYSNNMGEIALIGQAYPNQTFSMVFILLSSLKSHKQGPKLVHKCLNPKVQKTTPIQDPSQLKLPLLTHSDLSDFVPFRL